MNVETITKLLDAGYTKTEIDAMQSGNATGGEGDEGTGKEAEATGEKSGNDGAENESALNPEIAALTKTVNELTATVKAIQESNVKGAATKSASAGDKINDAMKSFIEKL